MKQNKKRTIAAFISGCILMSMLTAIPVQAEVFESFENGEFENGISGWTTTVGGWTVKNSFDSKKGKSMYFQSDSCQYESLKHSLRVEKNTDYIISFKSQGGRQMRAYVVGVDGNLTIGQSNAQKNGQTKNQGYNGIDEAQELVMYASSWWGTYEYYFNSGDNEEVAFMLKDTELSNTQEARWLDDFKLTKRDGIINGSFESETREGYEGWINGVAEIKNSTDRPASDGSNFMSLWGSGSTIYQPIEVEPNTDYELSLKHRIGGTDKKSVLGVGVAAEVDSDGLPMSGTTPIIDARTNTVNCGNDWKEYRVSFNSGDNTKLNIALSNRCWESNQAGADIDDVKLSKAVGTIRDGGFETGTNSVMPKSGWERAQHSVNTDAAHSGKYGMEWWGRGCYTFQTIPVKKNTVYKLSFWYNNRTTDSLKGDKLRIYVADEKGIANDLPVGVSLIGNNKNGKTYPQKAEWTEVNEYFNTGSNEKITLIVRHDNNEYAIGSTNEIPCYVDDFELNEVSDIIFNGGFEENGLGNWNSYNAELVTDAYGGNKAVKLSNSDQAKLAQTVYLEKHTDYTISYWYKNEAYGHNLSIYDSSYDSSSTTQQANRVKEIKQVHDITDGWTYLTEVFNSGDNDKVTIEVKNCDKNSVTYFDDFLFNVQPEILNARLWGYPQTDKKLYAWADGINMHGDTLVEITYQWQQSNDGEIWSNIAGAHGDSYTVKDETKKYRVGITAVGEELSGVTAYSNVADSTGKDEFETAVARRINEKMNMMPGWFNNDNKDFAETVININRAVEEYGVDLSSSVRDYADYINLLTNMAAVESAYIEVNSSVINVKFTAPIKTADVNADTVKLTGADGTDVDVTVTPVDTVTINGVEYAKGAVITPSQTSTSYVVSRTTAYGLVYKKDVEFRQSTVSVSESSAKVNGNTVAVTANLVGESFNNNVIVVAAVYGSDGSLLGAASDTKSITEDAPNAVYSKTVTIPENTNVSDIGVRLFVWNGTTLVPYTDGGNVTIE